MKEVVRLLEMAKEIQNMENELRKIMPTAEDIFDAKRYYDDVTEACRSLKEAKHELVSAVWTLIKGKRKKMVTRKEIEEYIEGREPDVIAWNCGFRIEFYICEIGIIVAEVGNTYTEYYIVRT